MTPGGLGRAEGGVVRDCTGIVCDPPVKEGREEGVVTWVDSVLDGTILGGITVMVAGLVGGTKKVELGLASANETILNWLACSRAVANASTLMKRFSGSLARAMSNTCSTSLETFGTLSRRGGRGASICWVATSKKDP